MKALGIVARTRVRVGRPVARGVHASKLARALFLRGRADAMARGLDPDLAMVLALDAISGDSRLWTMSPKRAREKMTEGIAMVEGPAPSGVRARDLRVDGGAGTIGARLYEPEGLASPSAGVVFFHGGGWVTGDLETHDGLCREFAARGRLRVLAIDYRLAPEHPFPAAADDAVAGFRFVATHAHELGLDPRRLAVAGDSAGGNLAAVVGLETRDDDLRPALQVLLYAGLDATCTQPSYEALADGYYLTRRSADWYYGHYAGPDAARRRDPRLSPLFASDLRRAPRALVAIAAFDPLRDEEEAYVKRLGQANVPVDRRFYASMIHGFALMTGLCPAARRITDELIDATAEALDAVRAT